MFSRSGVRYLALLIKDNAVPIDECFCQFASIEAIDEGLESIKISEDAFLEVATYLLGEFLDAPARLTLFHFMDVDQDGLLGIQDWREALASAEFWMSEDGKNTLSAIRIQSAWRGHFERSALVAPASGMFTIESVFQPMENQKYWEDEDEVDFFNHIPETVIDDTLSAHDILSALTALAHPKGFTPLSLFAHICKSSSSNHEKSFELDEFVECFLNLCGEKLTDQLYEALSQAFNQLLDLNGDGMVSSSEFLWVMRQFFEAQHASSWIEAEPTLSVKDHLGSSIVFHQPEMRDTVAPVANNEAILGVALSVNESRTSAAHLYANQTVAANAPISQNVADLTAIATSTTDIAEDVAIFAGTSISSKTVHPTAAMQLAEAAAQAAQLKISSEAAAAKQLADAAATKLAAEKLFAEANELKKTYEAAAAKQMAEASAIKQAAQDAAAKRTLENVAAKQAVETAALKQSTEIAASKRTSQFVEAGQFAVDLSSTENSFSVKSSKSATGKQMNSSTLPIGPLNHTSIAASTSVEAARHVSSAPKHPSFDPRTLVDSYDALTADEMPRNAALLQDIPKMPRPSSSGDQQLPKSVRFASNRPSTSDGNSRSLNSSTNAPSYTYASQSHQSRQPNSQQQFLTKIQDETLLATKRAQDKPATSFVTSSDYSPAVKPHTRNLPDKIAVSETTKRVLLVDVENACTWIRTCAQKIGSRYVVKVLSCGALHSAAVTNFTRMQISS